MKRRVKIVGIGKYLPKKIVTSEAMDQQLQLPSGWTYKKSGVKIRHYVEGETASYMGAMAAREAIDDAGISLMDIDCIISGSGTMEQPIPCNAALIQKQLGLEDSGIPCFDVNTTCLSFVNALDIASLYIELGVYETVLIVSSEIASVGLNWRKKKVVFYLGMGQLRSLSKKLLITNNR